jgi:hypothetical protein
MRTGPGGLGFGPLGWPVDAKRGRPPPPPDMVADPKPGMIAEMRVPMAL